MPRNPKQDENLKKNAFTAQQGRDETVKNGKKVQAQRELN